MAECENSLKLTQSLHYYVKEGKILTEGDRGLRKSFILQELCHVNRNEKGFRIFFQVFGVNEITPFYYRK